MLLNQVNKKLFILKIRSTFYKKKVKKQLAIIVEGRVISFILWIATFATFYYLVDQVKRGKKLRLRRLPAIDGIDEIVGRAVEIGRPVLFTDGGTGSLASVLAPQLLAGVRFGTYLAEKCAELDAELLAVECHPDVLPLLIGNFEDCYRFYGKDVPPETVLYIPQGYSYTLGCGALIRRERVAGTVMVGPFQHEAVFVAEAGMEVGAIQVAGTARSSQIAYFAATVDYPLIGEDIYAGAAYLSGIPEQLGTIFGEDPYKIISIVLVLLAVISYNLNIPWLLNLLKL